MYEAIETEEYRGYTIEITPDYEACDWLWQDIQNDADDHKDHFTTYGHWNGYDLFDVDGYGDNWLEHIFNEYYDDICKTHKKFEYSGYIEDYYGEETPYTREEADKLIEKWIEDNLFVLPVYVYEHSGITMRAGSGYSCQWDSGLAGFIYSDKRRAKRWLGVQRLTKQGIEKIMENMKNTIAYYADIVEGNVYGYCWDYGSCGGYVGVTFEELYKEAQNEIDYYLEQENKKHVAKKKAEIKNNVPLLKRV